MRNTCLSYVALVFILVSCNAKNKSNPGELGAHWVSLFNGENLDGWTMKISGYEPGENIGNTFRVEDGILSVRYDEYDSFNNKFGALHFKKAFSDFRLKVEYRFVGETAPGAPSWGFRDSGIQYHGQDPESMEINQPFPVCLEYNLHGGNGIEERPVGQICANGIIIDIDGTKVEDYCTPAKVAHTFHGDQWVTLEVESKNGIFRHFVNGEEILSFSNARYNSDHEYGKIFYKESDNQVKGGFVSLQSNSHPIDFRKIEIIEY